MESVTIVLVLLLAVLVSGMLARLSPVNVPLPILQIVIGALLAAALNFDVRLDPEIFFLLFIPPLLFLDGWRIPKGALFRDWRPILTLAVGLVVFTVLGVGLLIDQLIPAVPLAVAFALAAILSPTDPVAVSAITRGIPIPARLMHILEGESLLNDASGLVCFRFAVAAALTGTFSLRDASAGFLLTAAGGLIAGTAVAWAASASYSLLSKRVGEEPGSQILISILIPFAAYLLAEHVHASGILAAAAAGISMHYADLTGRSQATTRMRRSAVWDMLQTALNGIIFVLLGQQLPGIFRQMPRIAESVGVGGALSLGLYVVVITVALTAVRFFWIGGSILVAGRFAKHRGEAWSAPSVLFPFIAALAGVRGAITLAGVLTLPMTMPGGGPFPARDLAIFLALGVILLSLAIASIGLPVLAGRLGSSEQVLPPSKEVDARTAAAEAAIREIEREREGSDPEDREVGAEAAARVIDLYRRRIEYGHADVDEAKRFKRLAAAEAHLRTIALRAERDEYYRLRLAREIGDPLHQKLVREVDLLETSISDPTKAT
ncbi:Na+/H+ antiporter [Micromonospora sp. STR1s_5]|nr:Na+/H+ antiporter [Micromonospora sp. STR1s_5]